MKPKQNQITNSSTEKFGTCSQCDCETVRQKEQKGAKFRNMFLFLKTIDLKIDYYH